MSLIDKAKLGFSDDIDRRASVLTVSDVGSEFDIQKKIKYGKPLAGC
jgi:hypothetical protein